MTNVWYALAAIVVLGGGAIAITFSWHRLVDWWENRNSNTVDWPTTSDNVFPLDDLFEPQPEPEPEPVDPWADWTDDELAEATDKLDVIRAFARAGFDEIPKPGPLPVEEVLPPMLFDNLTAEYRQVNPQLAGNTATWMMPSPDIDQAIADPYQRWSGFVPQLEPARVPAQRDGES